MPHQTTGKALTIIEKGQPMFDLITCRFASKTSRNFRASVITLGLTTLAAISTPLSTATAGAFDKGSSVATLSLGSGQYFSEDYFILGAGIGYYLIDGLEAGLDLDVWTGGDPSIYEVTPKLTYVYDNSSHVKPYIGAFYNRTFIEDREDSNALGYRVGFYAPAGNRAHIGIGVVHTELQDCSDSVFYSCSDTYTELSFLFSL